MAKAQFKLLIFLLTVGLMLGCMATAAWFYLRVIRPEWEVKQEIENLAQSDLPKIDPGARRFDAAVDLIRLGKLTEGRDALYNLLRQFPESPTCTEAKRIIGEMNLDRFFSPTNPAGKIEYIVQPGDALTQIARKHQASLDAITRMNVLRSTTIHVGDRLLILPLDFDFVVDVSDKTVTVLRQGRFFAQYPALDVRLPPSLRVPTEMTLRVKSATLNGEMVSPIDPMYVEADKWVPGTKPGAVFRPIPVAKVVTEETPEAEEADSSSAPTDFGIFLAREDLEEVFALARSGAKLSMVR